MILASINHPKIKIKKMYHPLEKEEFRTQLNEVFIEQNYRLGRRKCNAVYLDLGANIGSTCLYFKDWASHIYAVEPCRENFEALTLNTKKYKNISRHNYAIAPLNQEGTLFSTDPSSVPQTFFPDKSPVNSQKVKCISIDAFFKEQNIDHVDVMKIDVEGSEYVILPDKSFANVADKIDFIIGEAHYNLGFAEIIPEILKDYGFKTKFLKFNNMIRTFAYGDAETGQEKVYRVPCQTIFVAWRENV